MSELTPREIVAELDKYIIGQNQAKRMVAIAVRNRWRRQRLAAELRNEVAPRNIIMMGPTGVGKTEIARRLAKLCSAPFIKVEATKYTEVGYVGRDVESMIRDLMEIGINGLKRPKRSRAVPKPPLRSACSICFCPPATAGRTPVRSCVSFSGRDSLMTARSSSR